MNALSLGRTTLRIVAWRLIPFVCLLYLLNILDSVDESFASYKVGVGFSVNVGAACVLIIGFQSVENFTNRYVHSAQPIGVNGYFVLLHKASKTAYIGYALRAEQLPSDYPVLDAPQLHRRVLFLEALFGSQCILINLAQACRKWHQFRRTYTCRYLVLDLCEAFKDLLPRPIHVCIVCKNNGYDRQAEP